MQGKQGADAVILNSGPIFSSRVRLREKKGSQVPDVFVFGCQSKEVCFLVVVWGSLENTLGSHRDSHLGSISQMALGGRFEKDELTNLSPQR